MREFHRHGLTGKSKQHMFDLLYEQQEGKCFICGISQAEIIARCDALIKQRGYVGHLAAPVHRTLHIDHCHITGMIRGLLCERCNTSVMYLENHGMTSQPADMDEKAFNRCLEIAGRFLEQYHDRILAYMQQDRWIAPAIPLRDSWSKPGRYKRKYPV